MSAGFKQRANRETAGLLRDGQRSTSIMELETRLAELNENTDVKAGHLGRLGDRTADFSKLRLEWRLAYKDRADLLEKQCTELTRLSKSKIRATLRRAADTAPLGENAQPSDGVFWVQSLNQLRYCGIAIILAAQSASAISTPPGNGGNCISPLASAVRVAAACHSPVRVLYQAML